VNERTSEGAGECRRECRGHQERAVGGSGRRRCGAGGGAVRLKHARGNALLPSFPPHNHESSIPFMTIIQQRERASEVDVS